MKTTKINGLEWSTELLDGGARRTQKEWKIWCKANGWRLPTFKEYDQLNRKLKKGKFRDDLINDYKKHWLITNDVMFDPIQKIQRAFVLGVVNVRFLLDAGDDLDSQRPARGVVVSKKDKEQ